MSPRSGRLRWHLIFCTGINQNTYSEIQIDCNVCALRTRLLCSNAIAEKILSYSSKPGRGGEGRAGEGRGGQGRGGEGRGWEGRGGEGPQY